MSLYRLFKFLRVIGMIVITSVAIIVLLPLFYVAGDFIGLSFTDKTNWRIEDYMCTVPQRCDEFIAERRHARKIARPAKPN